MRFVRPVPAAPLPKPGTGGGALRPSLNLDFSQGVVDSRITTNRAAGGATYFDATGTLQLASANTLRVDYGPSPGGNTNWVKNSSATGAVVGSPGTLPSFWTRAATGGLSHQVVATGTENGLPYVDMRVFGTTTGTFSNISFDTLTTPTINGATWTVSVYSKMVAGSTANLTGIKLRVSVNDASQTYLGELTAPPDLSSSLNTAAVQRYIVTGTVNIASASLLGPYLQLTFNTGVAIDITLRSAAPQLEQNPQAFPWIPTSGAIVTQGATALGALIEESRTNGVRNPRGEGAVVGSPGTMPTNWVTAAGQSIAATGVEAGIPFVDCRFTGAAGVSGSVMLFDAVTAIAASATQIWSGSLYAKLTGGTLGNVTSTELTVRFYDNTSTFISQQNIAFVPSGAPLSTQRFTSVNATAPTNTAFVVLSFRFNTTAAYDFTLRFGGPQLELGAFPTSLILPAAGSPAATTRNSDRASIASLGAWFNGNASSLVADCYLQGVAASGLSNKIVSFNDGTGTNRLGLAVNAGTSTGNPYNIIGNVGSGPSALGAIANNVLFSMGFSITAGSMLACLNGGTQTTSTPAGLPPVTRVDIGNEVGGTFLNGWIRRIRYWPRAISSIELTNNTNINAGDTFFTSSFINGYPLDSRLVFVRAAGGATYFDSTGTLQLANANAPRFDYDPTSLQLKGWLLEENRTNSIRNPRCEGAVPGTPGTAPTNWTSGAGVGISQTLVGSGTESGIPYVDIRYFGTYGTSGSTVFNLRPEIIAAVAAAAGQQWVLSCYVRVVDGSMANFTSLQTNMLFLDSTPQQIGGALGGGNFTPTGDPLAAQRYISGASTAPANTASVLPQIWGTAPQGAVLDVTLRFGAPQLEKCVFGIGPTSVILPPAGSPAATTRNSEIVNWSNPPVTTTGGFSMACSFIQPSNQTTGNPAVFHRLDDTTGQNRMMQSQNSNGFFDGTTLVISGVQVSTNDAKNPTPGSNVTFVGSVNTGQFYSKVTGFPLFSTTTGVTVPVVNAYCMNGSRSSAVAVNTWMQSVSLWNRDLSSAEVAALAP